jgi:hypothetical protein
MVRTRLSGVVASPESAVWVKVVGVMSKKPFVPERFLAAAVVVDFDDELFSVPLQIDAIGALRIAAVRVVAGAFHAAKALCCAVPPHEAGEKKFTERRKPTSKGSGLPDIASGHKKRERPELH